jgi:leader peptidase (prepilin peptidase)/N-methyltransferase
MSVLAIVFAFGAIVGSFLNVCIHRLPAGESVVRPRSHCPGCLKPILWYDNIPILSFLLLKGRCRHCHMPISLRYPLVELLMGMFFVLSYRLYGLNPFFIYYCLFFALLSVATFVDIQHQIIPDEVSLGGTAAALLFNAFLGLKLAPFSYDYHFLLRSFVGALVGAGIIYMAGFIFDLVYFRILKKPPVDGETSSMGFGDVKLMAMIGAFLGPGKAVLTFFLAPFPGAAVGIINLIFKKSHVIPYGPFLSLAAILSFLLADKIVALIIP